MWIRLNIAERHPHMDEDHRVSLDVRLGSVIGGSPPCGKNSDNLSTTLSTETIRLKSNLYIGEIVFRCPYMGVSFSANFMGFPYFST